MFKNSPFNCDISNWNISNVIDMSDMFYNSKMSKSLAKWKNKLNPKNQFLTTDVQILINYQNTEIFNNHDYECFI